MRERKQIIAVLLIGALILSVFSGTTAEAKKKKKLKFGRTKITMIVGDEELLEIQNNSKSKKVKWSVSNKKTVSLREKTKHDCYVVAKKTGTVVITAKVGKIKLKCKVKVKPETKTNTSGGSESKSPVVPSAAAEQPQATVNPTPAEQPTETPKTITTADNFQTLKEYIQANGFTNSSGNKVIKFTDADLEKTSSSAIVYDSLNMQFKFICTFESATGEEAIELVIAESDITHGDFEFAAVVSLSGGQGYATHELSTLNGESSLNWSLDVFGYVVYSDVKNLADAMYRLGYSGWNLLLLSECGFTMSDLGFDGGYVG